MQVKFWGTRGSISASTPETVKYGGNTSCVEVRSKSGTLIVIDCGTGSYRIGRKLMGEFNGQVNGHMLITHTHWDHIQGFPFFAPYFVPSNEWHIYGPSGFGPTLNQALSGQMQYTYFPISMNYLGAQLKFHDLTEGTFRIGDITVKAKYLNHPALTLGYRLEADGVSLVYACDHEPFSHECAMGHGHITGNDHDHAEFLGEADLVIHDSQYIAEEYESKIGWGHSTYEYAHRICAYADVKQLLFTHHDPTRSDDQINTIVGDMQKRQANGKLECRAASEGSVIDLTGNSDTYKIAPVSVKPVSDSQIDALSKPLSDIITYAVLLTFGSSLEVVNVTDIMKTDAIKIMVADTKEEILLAIKERPISLLVVDMDLDLFDLPSLIDAIRTRAEEGAAPLPLIAVSSQEMPQDADYPELKDWIIKPFSNEYLRTRIRSTLLQEAGKSARAPRIPGESARLADIQRYGLIDKKGQAKYDRLTRLVGTYFRAPICLITIVNADKQVFLSNVGLDFDETPRDQSFCAHNILKSEVLHIPDALEDARFAKNPLVTGKHHLRFYAGAPVYLPSGNAVGTICIYDTEARTLSNDEINALQDFATLVEHELAREEIVTEHI